MDCTNYLPELPLAANCAVSYDHGFKKREGLRLEGDRRRDPSILDILDRVPSQDRSDAGFTSEVFHDLLVRLEDELAELRRKIDSAVTWIQHLKEKTDTGFVMRPKDK